MIVDKYKLIFVHVPKAAGQSVEDFFLHKLGKTREERSEYLLRPNNEPKKGPPRLAHLTAEEYVEKGYISAYDFQKYFKFVVVRSPYTRVVSFYKFLGYSELISFKNFVLHYLEKELREQYWFLKPQSDFFLNSQGEVIVDFIAKMENLKDDFKIVCNQLSILPEELPHNNKSSKSKLTRQGLSIIKRHPSIIKYLGTRQNNLKIPNIYDTETLSIVEKIYQKDIEVLGYKFDY